MSLSYGRDEPLRARIKTRLGLLSRRGYISTCMLGLGCITVVHVTLLRVVTTGKVQELGRSYGDRSSFAFRTE
jgi:hypothetical protein